MKRKRTAFSSVMAAASLLGVIVEIGACHPPIGPLPPPAPSAAPHDERAEAARAFSGELPADARAIRTPDWAKLEAVWGTYDAPLVNELLPPSHVAFANERMLFVLAPSGEIVLWDWIRSETRARFDGCKTTAPAASM